MKKHRETKGFVVTEKKTRYEHTNALINGKFIKPTHVVLLTSKKACGRCPANLFCLREKSWEPLFKTHICFICLRCYVVGLAETIPYTTSDVKTLYVCTLLRTDRTEKRWKFAARASREYRNNVHNCLFANDLYQHKIMTLKELPYNCLARCRCGGTIDYSMLDKTVDCRTILRNAIGNVVAY